MYPIFSTPMAPSESATTKFYALDPVKSCIDIILIQLNNAYQKLVTEKENLPTLSNKVIESIAEWHHKLNVISTAYQQQQITPIQTLINIVILMTLRIQWVSYQNIFEDHLTEAYLNAHSNPLLLCSYLYKISENFINNMTNRAIRSATFAKEAQKNAAPTQNEGLLKTPTKSSWPEVHDKSIFNTPIKATAKPDCCTPAKNDQATISPPATPERPKRRRIHIETGTTLRF